MRRRIRQAAAAGLAGWGLCVCALAQDKPLNVNATFTTGYYATSTRGESNQSVDFVPVGARFDLSGYYMSPDLVSFSAQPELNLGPQASEAGFQGGNGIRLRTTFLRKSWFPLTFRYSNVQVEDIYFGGLTQVSGYSLKNRNKDLGLTWELKPKDLPVTIIDWGTNSVNSTSSIADVSDYLSSGNHLNIDSKYERGGWDLEAFLHHQKQNSDLLSPLGEGTLRGSLVQTVDQYQASARRGFLGDSEIYVDAGKQSTSSLLFTLPIDLSTHYVSGTLRLTQRRRWRTSIRTTYSSNLASQLLAQAAGTLTGPGAVAADQSILLPFSHGISNFNLNGITTVTLGAGFGVFGSVERSMVLSASQNGPLNTDYFTSSAGITYAGKFSWGNLSGQYARELGFGSVTGQSGTIQGQNYSIGAQHGRSSGFRIDGTLHGSDQTVRNALPVENHSFTAEASIADRIAGDFSARIGGGWQWGSFLNAANEFRSDGYTARAGIEHPRLQVSASINDTGSNSLPFYGQLLGNIGLGSVIVTPLRVIPSDYRAMSLTVHSNPLRKVEFSALWTRSRQHLDTLLSNDFELLNVFITYHFRRVQMEAGFIRSNQIFASYPDTLRKRLYIRFLRNARIL